jgi:hypothetical protein
MTQGDLSMPDDSRNVPAAGRFDTLAEYRLAIDCVISAARSRIRVFDRSLEEAGFNAESRFQNLRKFLLGGRERRLEFVLHDVAYVRRDCARLLSLQRQFSYAVVIHQTTAEARGIYDGILVADDAHYVHRFHFDHPRGDWVLNSLASTQPLIRRLEEIWQASAPAVSPTTLGL